MLVCLGFISIFDSFVAKEISVRISAIDVAWCCRTKQAN